MKQENSQKVLYITVFLTKISWIMQQYGGMLRQFFLFGITTLLIRGAHIVCMPLTLRLVSAVDYGLLALINSFIAISSACMGLGLRQALPLYYFEQNKYQQRVLIADIIRIYLVCAAPVGIAVTLIFFVYMLADVAMPWYMLICGACIAVCSFFVELCYQLLQYHQQVRYLTLLQSAQAAITIIGTLGVSLCTSYSYCAPLIAQLCATLCITMIACGAWYRYMYTADRPTPLYTAMRTYVATGICFVPSMLFGWILAASQRWIVARYLGLADVGIYAVADSLCQLSHLVCTYAMVGSHMPYMLGRLHAHPEKIEQTEHENRLIMWCAMACLGLILVIAHALCMPLLSFVVHTTFIRSLSYVFPLLCMLRALQPIFKNMQMK